VCINPSWTACVRSPAWPWYVFFATGVAVLSRHLFEKPLSKLKPPLARQPRA